MNCDDSVTCAEHETKNPAEAGFVFVYPASSYPLPPLRGTSDEATPFGIPEGEGKAFGLEIHTTHATHAAAVSAAAMTFFFLR